MAGFLSNVLCLGPRHSHIYNVYNGQLYVLTFDGDIVTSYILGTTTDTIKGITSITPIVGVQDYNNALFVTVEEGATNVKFRKWRLDTTQRVLLLQDTVKYSNSSMYSFKYKGFTAIRYDRVLTSPLSVGLNRIFINNTTLLQPGQKCIIGPSSAGSSNNKIHTTYIINVSTDYIDLEYASLYDFKTGDNVSCFDDLIFASEEGLGGSFIPSLYYLDLETLNVVSTTSVYSLRTVQNISFLNNTLYMTSDLGTYLYDCSLNAVSSMLYSYHNCDGYIPTLGIVPQIGTNFYTVQDSYIRFSNFECEEVSLNGMNLVPNTTSTYVNTISVYLDEFTFEPNYTASGIVHVIDQYGRGVYGRRVHVTSSDNTSVISSSNWYSDATGIVHFSYIYGTSLYQTITAYTDTTYQHRSDDYVFGRCYQTLPINNLEINIGISTYVGEGEYEIDTVMLGLALYDVPMVESIKYYPTHIDTTSPIYANAYIAIEGKSTTAITEIKNGLVLDTQYGVIHGDIHFLDTVDISTFIFISYFKPDPFSLDNPLDSLIEFFIYPSSYSLDIPTLKVEIMELNDELGIDTGWLDITQDGTITLIDVGGRYALQFEYDRIERYHYSSTVYCCITIFDQAPVPNKYTYCCHFGIVQDLISPVTISTTPNCGDSDVPANADICVVIEDKGVGVDNDSYVLYVDGVPVYYTVYTTSSGVVYIYQPTVEYFPGAMVTFSWSVRDLNGNMLQDNCYFNVEQSKVPIIDVGTNCGKVVDNRFSFSFDVYDAGSGVKYDSVELVVYNKSVPFLHDKILYRVK